MKNTAPPTIPVGMLVCLAQQSDSFSGLPGQTKLALIHRLLEGSQRLMGISADCWQRIKKCGSIDVSKCDTSPYEMLAADLGSRRPIDRISNRDQIRFGFQAQEANQQDVEGLNLLWNKVVEIMCARPAVLTESAA